MKPIKPTSTSNPSHHPPSSNLAFSTIRPLRSPSTSTSPTKIATSDDIDTGTMRPAHRTQSVDTGTMMIGDMDNTDMGTMQLQGTMLRSDTMKGGLGDGGTMKE
ncbi:hypothetical protein HKX48_005897, partial [Thoreauomyces humboldtii]